LDVVEIGRRLEGTSVLIKMRDSRTAAGIANWYQVIALMATGACAIAALVNSVRLEPWSPTWIWAIALASGFTAGLVTVASLSITNAIRSAGERRRRASNPGIRIKGIERFCKILSPSVAVYSYKFDVAVRHDNVNHFNYPFFWTGAGPLQVKIHNAGFQYLLKESEHGPWNTLMILFDKPRRRRDRFVVEFDIHANGTVKLPRPRYTVAIQPGNPKKADSLTIEFDESVKLQRVWIEDYANEAAPAPTAYRDVRMGTDRTVSWCLPSRVGWKYAINWEFA
jgi:hypothetical protein